MRILLDIGAIVEEEGISGSFTVSLEKPLILPDRLIPAGVSETVAIVEGEGEIDLVPSRPYGVYYTGFLIIGGRRVWTGRFQVPDVATPLTLTQLLALSPTQPPGTLPSFAPTALVSQPYRADAALSALRVVRVKDGDRLEYASSNIPIHAYGVLGILPQAVSPDEAIAAITEGALADSGWNWTLGQPIFLGINGQLTQVAPTTGFLLQVATPITPTQIQFEIQEATHL